MRLINTTTLDLKEFYGSKVPCYAILSHTWDDEEVSYQEWLQKDASTAIKAGYKKILGACAKTREEQPPIDWLWVDTNCIDKTSSADLSEAINSMFTWYKEAKICYAYLSDVSSQTEGSGTPESDMEFEQSRWFTRGWTLQELLAPSDVVFYSRNWTIRGARHESLNEAIARATGIHRAYLYGYLTLGRASVAEKMSWLARRTTTRIEDIAYCAMGLFDINMPLLYGEGMKAFVRLQEEIIRQSTDQTLFCWIWDDTVPADWCSMLAPNPGTFADSGRYKPNRRWNNGTTYSMSNVGLSICINSFLSASSIVAVLDVTKYDATTTHPSTWPACIMLRRPPLEPDTLERRGFPPGPFFVGNTTSDMARKHNLYVKRKTESIPSPAYLRYPNIEYAVMPFFLPLGATNPSNEHKNGLDLFSSVQIRPIFPTEYYTELDVLSLATPEQPLSSNWPSCGLARVSLGWGAGPQYWIFVLVEARDGRAMWHCDVESPLEDWKSALWNASAAQHILSFFFKRYLALGEQSSSSTAVSNTSAFARITLLERIDIPNWPTTVRALAVSAQPAQTGIQGNIN